MALETATYINQLVPSNPLGSDPLADADGHLRLIKSTLKTTFPNITGAVTSTQAQLNSPFPAGGIIMWSGSTGSIPAGWLLCDGNNGTPNLRDRFIVGAGNTYAVGATGGSATVTLSAANLPAHTHTFSGTSGAAGSHSHSINDPGHGHSTPIRFMGGTGTGGTNVDLQGGGGSSVNVSGYDYVNGAFTGISINSVGDHTHSFSGTTSSVGSGTAFSNLPPYYALAFIMKAAY